LKKNIKYLSTPLLNCRFQLLLASESKSTVAKNW
jgi:hypothetical protein